MDSQNTPASAGDPALLTELPRGWKQRVVEALVVDAVDHVAHSGVPYIRMRVRIDGPEGPALVESYWGTHEHALVVLANAFWPEPTGARRSRP